MPNADGGSQVGSSSQIVDGIILNADISASAAIARSKLDFGSGLVNADIAAAAAIALSKLATDPLARANHTGSQLSSTISDFTAAVQALVSTSFSVQDIPLAAGATVPAGNFAMASSQDGLTLFIAETNSSGTCNIYRFVRDSTTSAYYYTHTVALTISTTQLGGLGVVGSFLYVYSNIAGVGAIRRYAIADLTGVTSMTGTIAAQASANTMWSDGVDLYIYSSSGNFDRYTISGTAVTNAGTKAFTSAGVSPQGASDGTNVWLSDTFGGGTLTIRKYPIAGGAATATFTAKLFQNAYLGALTGNYNNIGFCLVKSGVLGIGWQFNQASATAVVGLFAHLTAIATP